MVSDMRLPRRPLGFAGGKHLICCLHQLGDRQMVCVTKTSIRKTGRKRRGMPVQFAAKRVHRLFGSLEIAPGGQRRGPLGAPGLECRNKR